MAELRLLVAAEGDVAVLRGVEPASLRQKLFHDLGLRFRAIGWICIAILLATGVVNLAFRGWLRWDAEAMRAPLGVTSSSRRRVGSW